MVQQRLCLTCNHPFDVPPTSKRRYCSQGCQPRRAHSTKPRPPVTVTCAECGEKFERKAWIAEKQERLGRVQYCSTDCRDEAKRGRKGEHRVGRTTKICPGCGEPFGLDIQPNELRRRKFCSRSCSAKSLSGRPRPGPEGTSYRTKGYVMVYVDPSERPPGREKVSHQLEHRLVMSRVLGRWPEAHETVHHINGDRTDNRPENLQLRSGHHGKGHILRCRCCGSSDIEYVELE